MTRTLVAVILLPLFASPAWSQTDPPLLVDMSRVQHKPAEVTTKDNAKIPAGTVELVDGQFGKGCRFSFVESTGPQFFTAWVNPQQDWDQFAGFSFWVKGDGSRNWGGLELIDGENYGLRYGYCFPIDSTDWVQVTVAWDDLTPELAAPPVDPKSGYAPSKFRNLWFGKWFYWREFPATSFTIERMVLEKTIARDTLDYSPPQVGLPKLLEKLKASKPITVVTMGDSLSDKRHWANREKLWSEQLADRLKKTYGSDVTLVNPAIGGTTLSQNMILMPRWLRETPSPDLVIVWFGFNDWDGGVRGAQFKANVQACVDRIRRATKGQSEILLLTTCPAFKRWETMNELGRATTEVAKERRTGLADVAGAFHQAGSAEDALKRQYWAWDNVHLGPAGHDLVTETVLKAIESR